MIRWLHSISNAWGHEVRSQQSWFKGEIKVTPADFIFVLKWQDFGPGIQQSQTCQKVRKSLLRISMSRCRETMMVNQYSSMAMIRSPPEQIILASHDPDVVLISYYSCLTTFIQTSYNILLLPSAKLMHAPQTAHLLGTNWKGGSRIWRRCQASNLIQSGSCSGWLTDWPKFVHDSFPIVPCKCRFFWNQLTLLTRHLVMKGNLFYHLQKKHQLKCLTGVPVTSCQGSWCQNA